MDILHLTLMGSYLYGTQHSASDLDLYLVVAGDGLGMEAQEKRGNIDLTTITLDHYRTQVERGHPRALDSLFATPIRTELNREALRQTIDPYHAITMFTRTSIAYLVEPTLKNRHHFIRVNRNLKTLISTGSYTPEVTLEERLALREQDHLSDEDWQRWAYQYALETAETLTRLL